MFGWCTTDENGERAPIVGQATLAAEQASDATRETEEQSPAIASNGQAASGTATATTSQSYQP